MATFHMYFKDAVIAEPGILTKALTEYPIFNEDYRDHLNKTIADHFHNQEIGFETPSLFELGLRRKMNLIMPLYNKHYITDALAAGVDPLQTMSMQNKSTNTGTTVNTGESNTDSTSESKSRTVNSVFPQSRLAESGDYAESAQDSISNAKATGEALEKSLSEQKQNADGTVTGSQGQTSMLLFNHRTTFVNVDAMILDELEELFMSVTSNGDEFSPRGMSYGYGNGIFGYNGHQGIW